MSGVDTSAPASTDAAGRIRVHALSLGFARAGIAEVTPLEAQHWYEAWLAAGRHAGMQWIASPRHRERRADPNAVLPGVRSVVCVALGHEPARDASRDRRLGAIARYAGGEDYHRIMRDLLGELQRFIVQALPGARALAYADTGAVLERAWAERAGLGWIGKHAGLIHPRAGSWLLLGEVFVDRPLASDAPLPLMHCGTCTRCLDHCPTRAIVAPHQVDARRCISYLTIEHRGPIPLELRAAIGDWIFGCDVCQDVCPWNRFAVAAGSARLHARALEGWSLERFLALDEAGFRALFHDSAIRRAKRDGFVRNVCVALGNRGEASAVPALARALAGDASSLVRGHAAWALGAIARRAPECAEAVGAALGTAAGHDDDASVREEARAAYSSFVPSTHAAPPSA